MICAHLIENRCTLAEQMSGLILPIIPTKEQCKVCSEEYCACDRNRVTASLAMSSVYLRSEPDQLRVQSLSIFLRKIDPEYSSWDQIGVGTGSDIKKFLESIWIYPIPNCNCIQQAHAMNVNGPQWCRQNMEIIQDAMLGNGVNWFIHHLQKMSHWVLNTRIVKMVGKIVIRQIVLKAIIKNEKTSTQIAPFSG